eukprot:TRINITY_DN138644_c0_g1_i1.p1 TRINITY_DN138644_c0_g1~~TRINITY_DN138644_c0_g1_i1.p1  ORF type:complete len:339 (+),score=32.11 TRINITY_DN138644_c0_g1_i1:92-1018(+)
MKKETTLPELAKTFDYFIVDVDGVLWESNKEIGNSSNALKYIYSQHKTVFFLTNDSYEPRSGFVGRVNKILNHQITTQDCYNTARTTAAFLKSQYPSFTSAYIVGGPGLYEELQQVGIKDVRGMEDSMEVYEEGKFWSQQFNKGALPDCVIVGIDTGFSFYKLIYAANAIRKGALFIATNRDVAVKKGKFLMPGAGAMVSAIQKASGTEPILIGKPNVEGLNIILKEIGEDKKDKVVIIGDTIKTDILLAKRGGIKSCLVLTGISSKKELDEENEIVPDYVMKQFGTFQSYRVCFNLLQDCGQLNIRN